MADKVPWPRHRDSSSEEHASRSSSAGESQSEVGPLARPTTLPNRSHFTRHFSLRQTSSQSSDSTDVSPKGPLGLTTVHRSPSGDISTAHIVFVHGLGGGSEHTWSKNGDLWPRDLLPKQAPFQGASVHIFGYDSNFKESSTLNIQDFSKSLLNSLLSNPGIHDADSPIIFVGHSMGGLVMKQTYIMAKQMPAYNNVATRITAIIFIATPHTGSELTPILERLFRMTSGLKPYLEDLRRNSNTLQTINTLFPAHAADLMIHSFYETYALSIGGLGDVMIVPKADAVLNYAHEQSALLGPPGCGKSCIAGHIVDELEIANHQCCFYFFKHGDKTRSSMENFLLSMTWQMFHFAPPADWLRTNNAPLIRVTKLGDILFAVKGEVAVVRKGLNRAVGGRHSTITGETMA
ncbi:NACHT and WD domain protein [Apiospora kogelbergensis]|uniref:NACHT and WD domain protein n=1 Tax=Apiospora kogelbergensis TaxID=1337665 RepID=UPI00312DCAD3